MIKRSLAVVTVCALVLGCLPSSGGGGPNPLSGLWNEITSSLPEGTFDPSEVDPDALFELINNGGGSIDLLGLADSLPGAIRDQLADAVAQVGDDAALLEGFFEVGDLQALIDELLGGFEPVLQMILDLFGLGPLDDLLADLLDLEGLLDGFAGDLQALLDELLALDGTLPEELACTLETSQLTCGALTCGTLTCEPVAHEIDLRPGLDALLTLSVDVDGNFQGSRNVTLHVTVDLQCVGTDCASILDLIPVEFPFTYTLEASDL